MKIILFIKVPEKKHLEGKKKETLFFQLIFVKPKQGDHSTHPQGERCHSAAPDPNKKSLAARQCWEVTAGCF